MTRDEIFREMEQVFGRVPVGYKALPDQALEPEWTKWKNMMIEGSHIPPKYYALMGLAVAAATANEFDSLFFCEMAKMSGASIEEFKDAAYIVKELAGWGAFARASCLDPNKFSEQMNKIMEYASSKGGFKLQEAKERTSI